MSCTLRIHTLSQNFQRECPSRLLGSCHLRFCDRVLAQHRSFYENNKERLATDKSRLEYGVWWVWLPGNQSYNTFQSTLVNTRTKRKHGSSVVRALASGARGLASQVRSPLAARNTLTLVSFAGMTLDKCIVLPIWTLTGCPLCRESHPLCRLKSPTVISICLLVGFHPATQVYTVHLLIMLESERQAVYRERKKSHFYLYEKTSPPFCLAVYIKRKTEIFHPVYRHYPYR